MNNPWIRFFPTFLMLLGIIDIILSKSNSWVRFYVKLNKVIFGRTITTNVTEEYIQKSMFYGGIGIVVLSIGAQIYFLL